MSDQVFQGNARIADKEIKEPTHGRIDVVKEKSPKEISTQRDRPDPHHQQNPADPAVQAKGPEGLLKAIDPLPDQPDRMEPVRGVAEEKIEDKGS
jgi:hypothetical protein